MWNGSERVCYASACTALWVNACVDVSLHECVVSESVLESICCICQTALSEQTEVVR